MVEMGRNEYGDSESLVMRETPDTRQQQRKEPFDFVISQ